LLVATSRAFALLSVNLERDEPVEREVRECARLLSEVADFELSPDEELLVRAHHAACHALLGNRLVAVRDLTQVIERSRAEKRRRPLIEALGILGVLRRTEGKTREAMSLLEEASSEAAETGDLSQAFECCFEAYRAAAPKDAEKAALLLKRCQRFHPFAAARTPNLVRYERLAQAEEA
jgi:hypothetical protein